MVKAGGRTSYPSVMPDYGIDAPGVVIGFFAGAFGLVIAGWFIAVKTAGLVQFLAWPVLAVAAVMLALGASMLIYAFIGKQRLRDHLLRHRQWRGDETVLDIGAGRGLMAVGAALRAPYGKVIALDIWSAKDLTGNTPDALRRNAKIEGVENRIEILTGDAQRLELVDQSIDAVVSVFCIHNIEQEEGRLNACREIARVLKPGGVAMIADFPGVSAYVDVLNSAGLRVTGPLRADRIVMSIAGYLIASKDAR